MELPENYQNMDPLEYKSYHESLMQNNPGSSPGHVFFCIFTTVITTILSSLTVNSKYSLFLEYFIIIVPLVLSSTVLADYLLYVNAFITFYALAVLYSKFKVMKFQLFSKPNKFKSTRTLSVTILRGLTYLITIFCILAVDFSIFPRYLAKTEKNGYSLMDTGVGLFVIMSGIVHKDYNGKLPLFIKNNSKLVFILMILGISRVVTVKYVGYQEHVTEYGVHWNFFFTLAVAKTVSSLIVIIFHRVRQYLLLSFAVTILHENLLCNSLENWVFSDASRNTFASANREGISSCLGYVAMYLFGMYLKSELSNRIVVRQTIFSRFLFLAIFMWCVAITMHSYRPSSRVLANAGYCMYIESVTVTILLVLYTLESLFQDNKVELFKVPNIVQIMNDNGFLLFLCANIITGAINLSTRTLFLNYSEALIILNVYMIAVIVLGVILQIKGIKI